MDPTQLYLDQRNSFVDKTGRLVDPAWRYLTDLQQGLTTIDLTSQVTGVLPTSNGGTGHDNLVFTTSGSTNVTLPTSGTVVVTTSPVTAVELTVTQGVTPNSGGIKHGRITTGSVTAGGTALVTLTWGTPFADANYTVAASVVDSTAAVASLSVVHVESVSAAAVKVRVQNTAAGNITGLLHAIAMHD